MSKDFQIVNIEILPLTLPLSEPFSIASGEQPEVRNVLLKITLGNGIIGLGEAAPFPAVCGETQESSMNAILSVRENLLNADIRNWKKISASISKSLVNNYAALCCIQMALTDALCKSYHIPLGVLFGGASDSLTTDMTVTSSDIEHAEYSAKAIINRGIRTIKIKTGGQDVNLDFQRIKCIKEAAPEALLSVDGNCGYSLIKAIELVDMLAKNGISILFFEQPLPRDQWKEMAILAKETGIKIAADESARNAQDVLKIAESRCAHVINIKLMKCGLFEAMKMTEIAKAAGLELMIGGMVETILSMTFSAHFAAGTGGFKYADLDTPLFIPSHPFKGGFSLQGDIITVNNNIPGHGVELA
jgi:L-alanine-DL-glutamate epimerase-like enolase superfamily enzyme